MHWEQFTYRLSRILMYNLLLFSVSLAQSDSTKLFQEFDSELLRLKVPEAFQKSSLKLEIFSDSTWQLYRGETALDFISALILLGQFDVIQEYKIHQAEEKRLRRDFRSRRVFSMISAVGGASYLMAIWEKDWIYHIPGYVAIAIAAVRYQDSRKLETLALREKYYQDVLVSPTFMKKLVDDYNFKLYQFLTGAGIQFSDS